MVRAHIGSFGLDYLVFADFGFLIALLISILDGNCFDWQPHGNATRIFLFNLAEVRLVGSRSWVHLGLVQVITEVVDPFSFAIWRSRVRNGPEN